MGTKPGNQYTYILVVLLAIAGCGDGGADDDDDDDDGDAGQPGIPGLLSIDVTPPTTTIVIDDMTVFHDVALTATGRFESGDERDITDEVDWGVDNAAPGDFVGPGAWKSSNAAGGQVTVEARSGSIAGNAAVTVVLEPIIDDPDNPPPPGADDLFDPTTPVVTGDPNGPQIVYPAHEVMFPNNIYRVLFQYLQGTGSDVFRIRFVSDFLDMRVYTTGDRWQADETTWAFLATTNAGAKVVMTVAGVNSADPTTIYESDPIDVFFSLSQVEGAIYYWSTSSEGVMKGKLSQAAPEKFYTVDPDTTCVACHTVSRDGTRLAGGYGGETLQEVSIPERDVLISQDRNYKMGWSTFSPDGTLLLINDAGTLTLLDSDTGDPVGPSNGVVDLGGQLAMHPDWSPLGDYVAVAVCQQAKNKDVERCGISRLPYNGGAWGNLEELVPFGGGDDNNFFPKYSPNSRWIAYVNSTGKSKNQITSELRMVPAGGGDPIVLTKGNRRVGPDDGIPDIGNSMPTWAPSSHPGTQWIAFSSLRDYGLVLSGGEDQLWVVAVDLDLAGAGEDPTFASFWLPQQSVDERNHRAFWAVDTDDDCPFVEVCDGFDNDCDGIVDEDCAECTEEICFDGIDNDCDGQIDEGCIG